MGHRKLRPVRLYGLLNTHMTFFIDPRIRNVGIPIDSTSIPTHVCEISTRTITCVISSLQFAIREIYDSCTPVMYTDFDTLKEGSIIYLKYEMCSKGVLPKRPRRERTNVFRNSLTVIMYVSDSNGRHKLVNMKVPPSGMIQFTGCVEYYQAIRTLYYFLQMIYNTCPSTIEPAPTSTKSLTCTFTFKVHMTNVKVHLSDKHVNQKQLQKTLNKCKSWRASFDASGYSGVNIKIGYHAESPNITLPVPHVQYCITNGSVRAFEQSTHIQVDTYVDYYNKLPVHLKTKEQQWFSNKMMTLLVFQTGTLTLSGIHEWLMAPLWSEFVVFLNTYQDTLFFAKDIFIVDY